MKTFTNILRQQVKLMEHISFDYIVSACATCSYTLKKYGEIIHIGLIKEKKI